jgi:dUTP pyrophosphatase
MYLQFKKLNKDAVVPDYAHYGDAGLDLIATSVRKTDLYWEYGTGLAVEMPVACVGLLFPRSSISKTTHCLRNSVGVIDSGYRGEIKVRMSIPSRFDDDELTLEYRVGDKVAQLIVFEAPRFKVVESEELSESARGLAGFGSSGR